MEDDKSILPLIDLEDLPNVIEVVDMGDVRYPFYEVYKRVPPTFGHNRGPDTIKHLYKMSLVEDMSAHVLDSFVDVELRQIKNTRLKLQEAGREFGALLKQSGRKPTHLVRVGKGLYAVISATDMHVKVGLIEGQPAAVLINMFDQFPVFRLTNGKV